MTKKASSRRRRAAESSGREVARVPTGTVTFLFTDIEGSTVLWENCPAQMQDALTRHDEILRAAVEASGGHVFKMVGDACCATFATAREALEASLAAQRALFAEPWDQRCRLKVRMALHTGAAEERDGDYFGPPVNRVARLLSTGHGGQVLLSGVTQGLVRDVLGHLEPGAELRDLGEHQLRDLKYTERVYQLDAPDLPKEFPPLKTHRLVTPAHGGVEAPPPVASSPPPEETRDAGPEAGHEGERYTRKSLMGSGGMAEVYLAHDEVLDRDVALKVLRKQYADDEQFVERFEREAKNAASLSHPNIVAVHDRGRTEDGSYYIVMECVTGGTLKEHILKEGSLPAATAVELTLQIARALEAAHRRGVVHRDIKPQNVLLTESGEAKVADFGIARAAASSTMTNTGSLMGTAHYLSPEQAMGQPAGPKSDLYSLGVILYEMLTGELPHDAETPMGIAMKHVNEPLHPPKEVNPDVPEGINAVCVRLLARNPEDRYRDATELMEDLERVQRDEFPTAATQRETSEGGPPAPQNATPVRTPDGPSDGPQAPPTHSKRMVLLATAVGLLLLLLTGGVAMALTGLGPVAGLLGGSEESQTVPEAPAAQSSGGSTTESTDDQKNATTEKASAAQASAAQPNQGSSPAAPSGGGTTEQSSASGTNGEQSNSAGTGNSGSNQGSSESIKKPVPYVVGLPYGEAVKTLKDQGFTQLGGGSVESDKPQGTVISTDPTAGTPVDPAVTTIAVYSSNGQPTTPGGGTGKSTPLPKDTGK